MAFLIFLVKNVHSSTKLAVLETIYWRNDLHFLYFGFIVFSIVTLRTGSYMSQVSKQGLVFSSHSDYFHKISNQV